MKELQKVIKESTVSPGIVTDSLATCKQASVVFASSLVVWASTCTVSRK